MNNHYPGSALSPPKAENLVVCPICCSAATRQVNELGFYSRNGSKKTSIMLCRNCGLFWRVFEEEGFELKAHYEVTSYTNLEEEENWKRARSPFFSQLITLIQGFHKSGQHALLDFGCSYGHLMDIAARRGLTCAGVEVVDQLRERLRPRYAMYKTLEEVGEERFDAITCIDSLYCSPNPVADMVQMAHLLKDDGVMVVRIANRAPLLRLMLLLHGTFTNDQIGDQLFAFNDKAVRLLAGKAGLAVRKVILREHKRIWDSWFYLLAYGLLPLFCTVTALKWTPGLTYILQKDIRRG
jgi:SAM-dependent methyltransferase